ncbi:hypothetical protein K1719_042628 [Acacia pycnantha]|nr:hypothetical protein K1719_042628 [Acacia pycnantha]
MCVCLCYASASCLQTLRIPESDIREPIVQQIAARLSTVTVLDVSKCKLLDAPGLALIGNNCRMLEELHRRMYLHLALQLGEEVPPIYEDEAMAIASTMRNLKLLDIGGHSINTQGVLMILGACSKLRVLSMWRCFNVQAQNLGLTKNSASCLQTVRIPETDIREPIVQQIAVRLSAMTVLDVSKCKLLDAPGLALIGNNCRMLEELHRRMYLHLALQLGEEVPPIYEDEAMAIASTMRNLKKLDIGGHSINTQGVLMILGACSKLRVLSMWRCFNVQAQNLGLTTNKFPKLAAVWGPQPTDSFILLGYHPWEPLFMYDFDVQF